MAKKIKKAATEDIRKMNDEALRKQVDESYKRMFALRLQKETLQLANHREIPAMRRNIARLKTIERQRELAKTRGGQ